MTGSTVGVVSSCEQVEVSAASLTPGEHDEPAPGTAIERRGNQRPAIVGQSVDDLVGTLEVLGRSEQIEHGLGG